jgi:hypothetical protein
MRLRRSQRKLELPVRMGIATGEAELRDDDYFGAVLNRGARMMAAGQGGQVLVADSAAALLGGVTLVGLGARRLRDVASPITVFQLQASGLRSEFPPLRTLDPTPGNLRPPGTSLVGRETELVEIAIRLAPEYPAGVWVFELPPSPIPLRCLTRWPRYSASSNNPERV